MNDEIKEILDEKVPILQLSYGNYVSLNKYLRLKDYITNLQQYYKDNVNRYEELIEKYSNLEQENERLKEENNNKAMNDYARAIDESWYRELYDDYKSRCEKAIEYIENPRHEMSVLTYQNLLNILQNGSEK